MKEVDLNILHSEKSVRGSGKTVEMLANVVGNLHFLEHGANIAIICHNYRMFSYIFDHLVVICNEQDISIKKVDKTSNKIYFNDINGYVQLVTRQRAKDPMFFRGQKIKVFEDNY